MVVGEIIRDKCPTTQKSEDETAEKSGVSIFFMRI